MSTQPTARPTRREFIRTVGCGLAAAAAAGFAPRLLAAGRRIGTGCEPRALILVQLEGGHDGLSTFVPLQDDDYHRLRPTLAVKPADLVALSATAGLSRAGRGLEPLFKDGKLAVVAQAGPFRPSPSHYRATEIWHTADDADEPRYAGWLGRSLDALEAQARPFIAGYGGRGLPRVLVRDADGPRRGRPAEIDPRQPLAYAADDAVVQLAEIGDRAASGDATEVYFVSVPGFDTHFDQTTQHAARLEAAAGALLALQRRLERRGVDRRVLTMVFSEFGRSAAENAQGGTDHGGAGPVMLLGRGVRGGFHQPLSAPVDFRRVIATVTERWLGLPAGAVIGEGHRPLALLV